MAQLITTEMFGDETILFKVDGVGEFQFNINSPTADVCRRAMIHGFIQKISDKAALGRDPVTGKSASPEDKFAAMKAMADRLAAGGEWNTRREGGAPKAGILLAALMRLYPGKGREALVTYLAGLSKEDTAKLRKVGRVVEAMATIRAERTPNNGDALLEGLED